MLQRARNLECQLMWLWMQYQGDGWSGKLLIIFFQSYNLSFRWKNPEVMPLYYTIEKKEDSQSAEWEPLTDHKIDPEEASYLSK